MHPAHDLPANSRKSFAHEFLVRERAIDFGGIEEGDTTLDGRPNQFDRLLCVCRRPVSIAQSISR
jgi:hypothetical protein